MVESGGRRVCMAQYREWLRPARRAWEPEPSEVTADEATPEALADSDRGDRLEVAKVWLERILLLGPRTSNEVKRAAPEAQVSWEAKRELRVRAVKEGLVWRWHLPAWHVPMPEVFQG